MKKKFGIVLVILSMCISIFCPGVTVWAASGATSVSVSAGSVNIGDTVTVTAKASGASGEKAVATMTLSYDANILQFVSCSATYGGGGSSVTASTDSFTVTLKAVAAGTSSVSLSGTDGVVFDTAAELDSMAASSTSVTVNNAAGSGGSGGDSSAGGSGGSGGDSSAGGSGGSNTATALSADNSLKGLSISPGTLSPSFSGKTMNYTATVANSVTSIAVTATPANEKAVVESVSGNSSLSVGSNAVKIVVKAENGVTATYTVNVTRQGETNQNEGNSEKEEVPGQTDTETGENTESITVGSTSYQIAEDFTEENIPADFTETTVMYHGTEYKGVSFANGSMNLLWLVPDNTEDAQGKFFVFDETRDTLYPFVKLGYGEKYVIALLTPVDFTVPKSYQQTSVLVDEENTITAYQKLEEVETEIVSEFYAFYAVNHEGMEGWYQYDAREGTYQRLSTAMADDEAGEAASAGELASLQEEYNTLSEKYKNEKSFARNMLAILGFFIAVMLIVIINLLVNRFRKKDDDDHFPEDGDGLDSEEDLETEGESDSQENLEIEEEPWINDAFAEDTGRKEEDEEKKVPSADSKVLPPKEVWVHDNSSEADDGWGDEDILLDDDWGSEDDIEDDDWGSEDDIEDDDWDSVEDEKSPGRNKKDISEENESEEKDAASEKKRGLFSGRKQANDLFDEAAVAEKEEKSKKEKTLPKELLEEDEIEEAQRRKAREIFFSGESDTDIKEKHKRIKKKKASVSEESWENVPDERKVPEKKQKQEDTSDNKKNIEVIDLNDL